MSEHEQCELVRSIRLRVPYEQAKSELLTVEHEAFVNAVEEHWVRQGDNVTPESKCWLFCWAATGTSSDDTAYACQAIWNRIFDRTYEWFDANIGHDFARKCRYRTPPRTL